MFRIARIRIKWIDPNQHNTEEVLADQRAPAPDEFSFTRQASLHPGNWRIRIRWIGFSPGIGVASPPLSAQVPWRSILPALPFRGTWAKGISVNRGWLLGLLAVLVGVYAWTHFPSSDTSQNTLDAESAQNQNLIIGELDVNGETLRIAYSKLDMGQPLDLFDGNIVTLARGLEANPFILNFEFSNPKPITGIAMDFGLMDFALRVQVYSADGGEPSLYEGEFRDLPPEPHAELDFVNGPALVSRIYIEIEQLNPPEEPHIHIREVLFKE